MMKRVIAIIMAIILCMTLIACSNQTPTQTESEVGKSGASEVVNVTSSKEEKNELSDETTTIHSEKPTENSTFSSSVTNDKITTEKETTKKAETPTQKVEETKPQTKPAQTQPVKPPEETTSKTTTTTTTIPSTETTSQKDESTTEPETQAPEQTEQPQAFDIKHWVDYAKNYAQSKGLVLDAAAIDCWDNPIRAGAHCIYLERDIQSRLNRYAKDEDITDVWIWVESVGNDCYDIYIGYA